MRQLVEPPQNARVTDHSHEAGCYTAAVTVCCLGGSAAGVREEKPQPTKAWRGKTKGNVSYSGSRD